MKKLIIKGKATQEDYDRFQASKRKNDILSNEMDNQNPEMQNNSAEEAPQGGLRRGMMELLSNAMMEGVGNQLGKVGEPFSKNTQEFLHGAGHGFPRQAYSNVKNIAQLLGARGMGEFQPHIPESGMESLGQAAGGIGATGMMAAPFMGMASAAIPGIGGLMAGGGAAGAAMAPEGERLKEGVIGAAIPGVFKGIGMGTRKAMEWLRRPRHELANHNQLLGEMQNALEHNKTGIHNAKENAANYLNQELNQTQNATTNAQSTVANLFPNLPESAALEGLSTNFGRKAQQLQQHFNKNYNNFYDSEAGKVPIKTPLDKKEILEAFGGEKNIPDATKKMIDNLATNTEYYLKPGTGIKGVEIKLPENPTTGNYVKFGKDLGSIAQNAFDKAKIDKTLSLSEKSSYLNLGKRLKDLQKKIDENVKSTIPEDYKVIDLINKDYQRLAIPMKKYESSSLFNAKEGGKIGNSFFKELLQPKNKGLREFLVSDPVMRKAIIEAETRGSSNPLIKNGLQAQAGQVGNLQNAEQDLYNLFSRPQQQSLAQLLPLANQEKTIEQLIGKVNSPQFDATLHSNQRNQLKNYSPQAAEHIENIESAHKIKLKTEKELKRLLELQKGKQSAAEKRENQIKLAKNISAALATLGIGGLGAKGLMKLFK